jgi:hypothetical protein
VLQGYVTQHTVKNVGASSHLRVSRETVGSASAPDLRFRQMADPLSIAASVLAIATAGYKTSISLYTLAETVTTASQRVETIASDIGSTVSILNQLRDLIAPEHGPRGTRTTIFNSTALRDISTAIKQCQQIFKQIHRYLQRATKQIKAHSITATAKIQLSASEKAKWPFLQPQFDELRNDLRDSKSNLLLMVTVAHLAITQKGGRRRNIDEEEEAELRTTIIRLQRSGTTDVKSIISDMSEEDVGRMQRFLRRVRGLKPSKEEKQASKRPVRGIGDTPKEGTRTVGESRNVAPRKSHEMSDDELPPVAIGSRPKTQAKAPKRVSHDGKSSDSGVYHIQSYLADLEPDTVSGNRTLNQKVTPNQGVEDATPIRDKLVELPDELVIEVPEDGVDMPANTLAIGMENTTVPVELVNSTAHSEMNDGRSVSEPIGETSRTKVSPEALQETPSARIETPDLTAQAAEKLELSITTGELAHMISKELMVSFEKMKHGENAEEVEKQEEFPNEEEPLHAWVSNYSGSLNAETLPLNISEADIQSLMDSRGGEDYSLLGALSKLNAMQRLLILRHVERLELTLCFVDTWAKETVTSFFGDLEIVLVLWVTRGHPEKEQTKKAAQEKELEEHMRKRLAQFGFQNNQIQALVDSEKAKQNGPLPPPGARLHAMPSQAMQHAVPQRDGIAQRRRQELQQMSSPPPPPPPPGFMGGPMFGDFPGPRPMQHTQLSPVIESVSSQHGQSRKSRGRKGIYDDESSWMSASSSSSPPVHRLRGRAGGDSFSSYLRARRLPESHRGESSDSDYDIRSFPSLSISGDRATRIAFEDSPPPRGFGRNGATRARTTTKKRRGKEQSENITPIPGLRPGIQLTRGSRNTGRGHIQSEGVKRRRGHDDTVVEDLLAKWTQ